MIKKFMGLLRGRSAVSLRPSRIEFASSRVALDQGYLRSAAMNTMRPTRRFDRRAPTPQDLQLSALAQTWRSQLPRRVSATGLSAQHPRLANRIALCWADPLLALQVIDGLLVDRRGGRRGFGQAVNRELLALRDLAETRVRDLETAEH